MKRRMLRLRGRTRYDVSAQESALEAEGRIEAIQPKRLISIAARVVLVAGGAVLVRHLGRVALTGLFVLAVAIKGERAQTKLVGYPTDNCWR